MKLARSLKFMFRHIYDVLSLSFSDYVHHIYPIKLKIKYFADTARSVSYLDIHIETDSYGKLRIDSDDWLRTKLYDKKKYLNFPIVNIPFICKNIPPNLHMEYISLSSYNIPDLVVHGIIVLIECCCYQDDH